MISIGNVVLIYDDRNTVKILQDEIGQWDEAMVKVLGQVGQVTIAHPPNAIGVNVAGVTWTLHFMAVTKVDSEEEGEKRKKEGNYGVVAKGEVSRLLIKAAGLGNCSKLEAILHAGVTNVNVQLQNIRMTALLAASSQGHANVVRILANHNANLELGDKDGHRAIHHAVMNSHLAVIRLLHELGADMNVKNNIGITPLCAATSVGNTEAIRCLLEIGCNPNSEGETPLHDVIYQKLDNMVILLLDHKADMSITDKEGCNALQYAVSHGNISAIEIMLGRLPYPSFVDEKNKDGFAALHVAARKGNVGVVKLLLNQSKASINAQDSKLRTPLHAALITNSTAIVRILVKKGCDVNAVDETGDTPLHYALWWHASLHDTGNQLVARATNPQIMFDAATVQTCKTNARFLAANGANLYQMDQDGKTPLDCCCDQKLRKDLIKCSVTGDSESSSVCNIL